MSWTTEYRGSGAWELKENDAHRGMFWTPEAAAREAFELDAPRVENITWGEVIERPEVER